MSRKVNFQGISAYESPCESPGFLLWHVSTSWRRKIEEGLTNLGLTHPQFVILATLGWLTRQGGLVTQAKVGKLAGLDPNTTSQILKSLEKKRLISRLTGVDRRIKNPVLTSGGIKILEKALPMVETIDRLFFDCLDENKRNQLIEIFEKLIK